MELNVFQVACLVLLCSCGSPLSGQFRKHKNTYQGGSSPEDDPGQPLYLTPYLQQGQLEQGTTCVILYLMHHSFVPKHIACNTTQKCTGYYSVFV